MVAGFDTAFALVLGMLLVWVGLLAAATAVARGCAGGGRDLPERVRNVLSGISRWAGIEVAQRRVARVVSPARRANAARPEAASRRRFSPGDRHPRA